MQEHNIEKRDTNDSALGGDESDDAYIKKIFSLYGDGNYMSFEGFQRLVNQLDVIQRLSEKAGASSHASEDDHHHHHHHHYSPFIKGNESVRTILFVIYLKLLDLNVIIVHFTL